ncbi:selenium-dependent molybdenum cofactor biosynthesis protein YqeB [uncultured Thermanaerothrix sp.]|uniref:selenium-dependent molybdenum cofactor biosynthesis protein YqeB n=1 Tax=uncultured Thermanaerothrix sp. TaxID=1195149 RepID=UPI00262BD415|nr:selenium-dependent molybdenum cofactor biosynthesis protein YqeB [uncultured Thermanaerothrix sp.]
MPLRVLVRGGGDLGSGVVMRLHQAGFWVLVTELEKPLVVRRKVAFAEAIYAGKTHVEEIRARRVFTADEAYKCFMQGEVPVVVDPEARARIWFKPHVLVDARLTKKGSDLPHPAAPLVIGIGPGFVAGHDCHVVIESMRGHTLGRLYWEGSTEPDTGIPESVGGYDAQRVLRAPVEGILQAYVDIGDVVKQGQLIAKVNGGEVCAPFDGVIRGLVANGLHVTQGMKIGDLDPRRNPKYCYLVSDKSLAIGGAALAAILSVPSLRSVLYGDDGWSWI